MQTKTDGDFVEIYMWNDDRKKEAQPLMNICAQKFVVCWISTISYLKFFF
jgi:hypothetical protein